MVHYENSQPAQGAALYNFWGSNPIVSIVACFVLVTLGQIVLSFLISTLFFASSVVRRNATLRNLLVVTVLVSVPPSLLYVERHLSSPFRFPLARPRSPIQPSPMRFCVSGLC